MSTTRPILEAAPKTRSPCKDESSFFGLDRSMELLGDDRVVAPPSSKRVTEDRWARVGEIRPDLARFGGCGVASSNFRRVSRNSFRSSSRSARSWRSSSSALAPAPIFLLWLAGCLACSECCPFGVRVWDPCPFRGIRHRCARSAALLGVQLVAPLSAPGCETASGKRTERRLAPHPTLTYSYATAWVLHNLNRTRTQNACVASRSSLALCCHSWA